MADLLEARGERHLLAWPGFGDVPADDHVRSLVELFDWVVERLPPGASHVVGEITCPTLLLWSDSDPVSPLAVGTFLAERIRTSRLATIAGGTHAFANERARVVAAAIDAHLRLASAGPPGPRPA